MNRIILTGILLVASQILFAQSTPTSSIRGTVVDAQSEFPMPGVTVILLNSDPIDGTTTDIDGNFRLENVPIGRHAIQVTFIGYE